MIHIYLDLLLKKQGSSDRSPKEAVSGSITKEEEEVVETLYALAGLVFPNNEANCNSKRGSEYLDANASALPESKNSPTPPGLVHYSLLTNLLFYYLTLWLTVHL